MRIQVLGMGCPNCFALAQHTRAALSTLGIDAEVEKVEDPRAIMAMGVMTTPALVVDGKVRVSGRVPSSKELAELLAP